MKEIVNQLISKGRELFSKNEYKGFLHIYYYEGITYLCWGEYDNNVEQIDLLT